MNRSQRRAEATKHRKANDHTTVLALATHILTTLAASDDTVTGATLMAPDGTLTYLDAQIIIRGGQA